MLITGVGHPRLASVLSYETNHDTCNWHLRLDIVGSKLSKRERKTERFDLTLIVTVKRIGYEG